MCQLEFEFKMGSTLRRAKHAQAKKCGTHFEFKLQLSSSNQQARESKSKQKQANLSNSKLKKMINQLLHGTLHVNADLHGG